MGTLGLPSLHNLRPKELQKINVGHDGLMGRRPKPCRTFGGWGGWGGERTEGLYSYPCRKVRVRVCNLETGSQVAFLRVGHNSKYSLNGLSSLEDYLYPD